MIQTFNLFQALANDRELVQLLTKIFPMSENQSDDEVRLQQVSDDKLQKFYKSIRLTRSCDRSDDREHLTCNENSDLCKIENEDEPSSENKENEEIFNENECFLQYREKLNSIKASPARIAQHIIKILTKICTIESKDELTHIDRRSSTTLTCLNFALDTMIHLQEQNIFSTHNQTTLKLDLMQLVFICISNLFGRELESHESEVRKLINVLNSSDDINISCGFALMTFTMLQNICMKNSKDKINCTELFLNNLTEIIKKVDYLQSNSTKLHSCVQNKLIDIILILKHNSSVKHKILRHHEKSDTNLHHNIIDSDSCPFEKILIASISPQQKPKDLRKILLHFKKHGICCCNATLDTIKIFYSIPVVPNQFLKLVESRIFKMIFQGKFCTECHRQSKEELSKFLNAEIDRRDQADIKSFVKHLSKVHNYFDESYIENFLKDLIIPRFQTSLESDPPIMRISADYFTIIVDCMDKITFTPNLFNEKMMKNIRECSLIPIMSANALHLVASSLEKITVTKYQNLEELDLHKNSLRLILFSNGLFLLKELVKIYDQLDLPKNVPLDAPSQSTSGLDNCDFEILDEKYVSLKEALSDIDIIFLNAIHWKVISSLIAQDASFRREFVTTINNNFSGDILFTIAFNAMNTITMKMVQPSMISSLASNKDLTELDDDLPNSILLLRNEHLRPILLTEETLTFERANEDYQNFYEITESFHKKLKKRDTNHIYRIDNSCCATFRTAVHRDIFLGDHVLGHIANHQNEADSHIDDSNNRSTVNFPHEWLTDLGSIWSEIRPSSWKDRIVQVISKHQIQSEEELKMLHRMNLICEITGCYGLKYFSSIARDCFDICWLLADNASFSEYMKFNNNILHDQTSQNSNDFQ